MTAPEKETEARRWMADDPKLEGIVMLMLGTIMPALQHGRDYGIEAFPDDDDAAVAWTNGAIFGVVAQYVTANSDAGLDGIIISSARCIRVLALPYGFPVIAKAPYSHNVPHLARPLCFALRVWHLWPRPRHDQPKAA